MDAYLYMAHNCTHLHMVCTLDTSSSFLCVLLSHCCSKLQKGPSQAPQSLPWGLSAWARWSLVSDEVHDYGEGLSQKEVRPSWLHHWFMSASNQQTLFGKRAPCSSAPINGIKSPHLRPWTHLGHTADSWMLWYSPCPRPQHSPILSPVLSYFSLPGSPPKHREHLP